MNPIEFGYVGKGAMRAPDTSKPTTIKPSDKKFAPDEQRTLNRTLGRVKLPNMMWDALIEDLKNKETKASICNKFNIRPSDLKWLKRYLGY
jgi:hypothetical protein